MFDEVYHYLAEKQQDSWIIKHRQKIIERIFNRFEIRGLKRCLDVGMGTGANVEFLERFCSDVVGIEFSELALEYASKLFPQRKFIRGDANNLRKTFKTSSFDLVTFFGVLCHKWIPDELEVLKQVNTILKPGGYIMLSEAAFNFLMRDSDVAGMTRRRYTKSDFKNWFEQAGFEMVYNTYFNMLVFPAVLAIAMFDRFRNMLLQKKEVVPNSPVKIVEGIFWKLANDLMMGITGLERFLIRSFGGLPVGVSLICIGRKSD